MLNNDFDHPRVWCPDCKTEHDGEYVAEYNELFLRVNCPKNARRGRVSTDAALFLRLREKHNRVPLHTRPATQVHYLHLTDRCSLACPICFAQAACEKTNHITLDDVRFRATAIRRDRGYFVTLTGGEPTEHPQFLDIVRTLRKRFGLRPSAITNGIRLAEDTGFARACKQAGLNKIHLSFDTFSPETSRLMRGRDLTGVKQTAIENIRRAGIAFSFVVTICRANLHEIGDILRFAAAQAPHANLLTFQPLQESGRYVQGLASGIDREAILHAIVDSGAIPELTLDDFLPAPSIPMTGACTHPDCAAMLPLVAKAGAFTAWTREPGFGRFVDALSRLPPAGRWRTRANFFCALFRHTGLRGVRRVANWVKAGKGESCFIVMIDNLMTAERRDMSRLARCGIRRCEADGTMRPACVCYDEEDTKT